MAHLDVVARPLAQKVGRLLPGRGPSVADVARERWTIHPAETQEVVPAYHLPGHVERIRRFAEQTRREDQLARVRRTRVNHGATVGYRLLDAYLTGGFVFAGGACHSVVFGRRPWIVKPPLHDMGRAALVSDPTSHRFFGDFLMTECATALLARESDRPAVRYGRLWPHAREYVDAFGLRIGSVDRTFFEELVLFRDVGQNADRRRRARTLRHRIRQWWPPPEDPPPGVFIRRGRAGAPRVLSNEHALTEALAARGFAIVSTDQALGDIMRQVAGTRVVVTVEGSQHNHGLLGMADDGLLIDLQPPDRGNFYIKDRCDALGVSYGFVVGEGNSRGFRVELDDILRVIEMAGI